MAEKIDVDVEVYELHAVTYRVRDAESLEDGLASYLRGEASERRRTRVLVSAHHHGQGKPLEGLSADELGKKGVTVEVGGSGPVRVAGIRSVKAAPPPKEFTASELHALVGEFGWAEPRDGDSFHAEFFGECVGIVDGKMKMADRDTDTTHEIDPNQFTHDPYGAGIDAGAD